MKFKLRQEKLQELLEKLLMKDIFPSCIITTEEGKLFSIQKEEHGRALRFAKFYKSFFDEIDDSFESIELDVEKTLSIVKNISPGKPIVVETKGNKVSITDFNTDDKGNIINEKGHVMLGYKEPEGKILEILPFEIKDDIPLIGESKLPLDIIFAVDLSELKNVTSYAGLLKTEFYQIKFEQNNIIIRIGDLHDFSDFRIEYPKSKIISGKNLEVTFTYGIQQVAETFRKNEIVFKTSSNAPAWIYEKTDDYVLGILIPPYEGR